MSKVLVVEHLTLDGVMQGPARPDEDTRDGFAHGGWGAIGMDPKMIEVQGAHMGSSWSLLAGRITYENFFSVWPKRPRPNPMGEALDNVTKFVASTTLSEPLPWQHSTLLRGDAADAVATLKRQHDKTLVLMGSGVLAQSLMRRDLIDEYLLFIHPLVLGEGHRLFAEGSPLTNLRLVDSLTTGTGVIIATYQPAAAH